MSWQVAVIGTLIKGFGMQQQAKSAQVQLDLVARQADQNAKQANLRGLIDSNKISQSLDSYVNSLRFAMSVNKTSTDRQVNTFIKNAERKSSEEINKLRQQSLMSIGRSKTQRAMASAKSNALQSQMLFQVIGLGLDLYTQDQLLNDDPTRYSRAGDITGMELTDETTQDSFFGFGGRTEEGGGL